MKLLKSFTNLFLSVLILSASIIQADSSFINETKKKIRHFKESISVSKKQMIQGALVTGGICAAAITYVALNGKKKPSNPDLVLPNSRPIIIPIEDPIPEPSAEPDQPVVSPALPEPDAIPATPALPELDPITILLAPPPPPVLHAPPVESPEIPVAPPAPPAPPVLEFPIDDVPLIPEADQQLSVNPIKEGKMEVDEEPKASESHNNKKSANKDERIKPSYTIEQIIANKQRLKKGNTVANLDIEKVALEEQLKIASEEEKFVLRERIFQIIAEQNRIFRESVKNELKDGKAAESQAALIERKQKPIMAEISKIDQKILENAGNISAVSQLKEQKTKLELELNVLLNSMKVPDTSLAVQITENGKDEKLQSQKRVQNASLLNDMQQILELQTTVLIEGTDGEEYNGYVLQYNSLMEKMTKTTSDFFVDGDDRNYDAAQMNQLVADCEAFLEKNTPETFQKYAQKEKLDQKDIEDINKMASCFAQIRRPKISGEFVGIINALESKVRAASTETFSNNNNDNSNASQTISLLEELKNKKATPKKFQPIKKSKNSAPVE